MDLKLKVEKSEDSDTEKLARILKENAKRVSNRENTEVKDLKEHLFPEIVIDNT